MVERAYSKAGYIKPEHDPGAKVGPQFHRKHWYLFSRSLAKRLGQKRPDSKPPKPGRSGVPLTADRTCQLALTFTRLRSPESRMSGNHPDLAIRSAPGTTRKRSLSVGRSAGRRCPDAYTITRPTNLLLFAIRSRLAYVNRTFVQ